MTECPGHTTHPICATPHDRKPSYLAVEAAVLLQGNMVRPSIELTHLFICY